MSESMVYRLTGCPVNRSCPFITPFGCGIAVCIMPQQNVKEIENHTRDNSVATKTPVPALREDEIFLLKNRLASARNAYIKAEEEEQSVYRLIHEYTRKKIATAGNGTGNGKDIADLISGYIHNGQHDLDEIIKRLI